MLRLWYAHKGGVTVGYFCDYFNDGDLTFSEGLDEVKQQLYLMSLGHQPHPVEEVKVSGLIWNNPEVVKYLLSTPELMVVKNRDLTGSNSHLDSVIDAWEKGGKITKPNPFYIGEHDD